MRPIGFLLLTLLHAGLAHSLWTPNDVTYLLPLPTTIHEQTSLAPWSEGEKGALIPYEYLQAVGVLDQHESLDESRKKLRAVALRVDHCFEVRQKCQEQIRIVFQPLTKMWGDMSAQDATVHVFYDLSPAEFKELIEDLKKLKQDFPVEGPLQVHPVFQREGYQSPYAQRFQQIILTYVGQKNISRITFMRLGVGSDKWIFLGFDVEQDGLKAMLIPRLSGGAKEQLFRVSTSNGQNFFMGQIQPEPKSSQDIFGSFVMNPRAALDPMILKNAAVTTRRIENPKIHSPSTMDCVSCHLSLPAGGVAFGVGPQLLDDLDVVKWTFNPKAVSLGLRKRDVRVLRALGYFEKDPVTSFRVINETQQVVDYLNSL